MNISLCLTSNAAYIKGTKVAIFSFLENNKWFNGDIIVYISDDVNDYDINDLKKIYNKIIIKHAPIYNVTEYCKNYISDYLTFALSKFELFGEDSYDKIIFLDSDMVVIKNIQDIVKIDKDFIVSLDTETPDLSFLYKKRNKEYINSGFFIVGKKYLNQKTKNELLNYSYKHDMTQYSDFNPNCGYYADQDILSCYFGQNAYICSNRFNYRFFCVNTSNINDIKIIHFMGDNKPWVHVHDRLNDSYWWYYYNKIEYMLKYKLTIGNKELFFDKDVTDKDKYIVCACAKNEDEYIEEWVKHNLQIGFDKIIIADNNDNPENLQNILKSYIENGSVQIFNCCGLKCLQLPIYQMIIDNKNFKWVACFDIDEFLEFSPKYNNIKELLSEINEDCLLVNWLMYGSNGQIQKIEGDVQERFKKPVYPINMFKENMFFKPIISNKIHDAYFNSSHTPIFNNGGLYNIGGYHVQESVYQTSYPIRYKKVWLKHYYTKSFNEYLEKINRGWPDENDIERLRNISHYFLLDKSEETSLLKFEDHIFSKEEANWVWDILHDYNVIVYLNPTKNYFSLLYYLGKSMSLVQEHTFIVEEDIDDNIFNMLFEIAQRTNNNIIACAKRDDIYWELYNKYNNGLGEAYYVVTVS